jgi:hypothetical protein
VGYRLTRSHPEPGLAAASARYSYSRDHILLRARIPLFSSPRTKNNQAVSIRVLVFMFIQLCVPRQTGTVLYTHRRFRTRSLKTIFGPVEISRMGYSHDGAPSIYPLDQTLALPARSFSYELQRRLVKAAVQNPFHE